MAAQYKKLSAIKKIKVRHCEERSDVAIQKQVVVKTGLPRRFAPRNDKHIYCKFNRTNDGIFVDMIWLDPAIKSRDDGGGLRRPTGASLHLPTTPKFGIHWFTIMTNRKIQTRLIITTTITDSSNKVTGTNYVTNLFV